MQKGGKIGKRALFPMLVVLLMVAGSFGSQIFVQDSVKDTGTATEEPVSEESAAATTLTGETETTESLKDTTLRPTAKDVNFDALDLSSRESIAELEAQGLPIPDFENDMVIDMVNEGTNSEDIVYEEGTKGGMLSMFWVDFNGPYGTPSSPKWEGDTITFTATHHPQLVYFRYELTGDGVWDIPVQVDDDATNLANWVTVDTVLWMYPDDFYGEATVQAWDGFSTTIFYAEGRILEDQGPPAPYYYIRYVGSIPYMYVWTSGWQFEVVGDGCSVVDLGRYKDYYQLYEVRLVLYKDNGQFLGQAFAGNLNGWRWGTFIPAFGGAEELQKGEKYRVGFAARLRYVYSSWSGYHRTTQQLPSSDECIKPLGYAAGTYDDFPEDLVWTDRVGMVDIHWKQAYEVPDIVEDKADVWVQNVPPNVYDVSATPEPAYECKNVTVEAWFDDQGVEDTFEYNIDWGDGTESGWTSIPLGTGMYGLNNVLVFDDNDPFRTRQPSNLKDAMDALAAEYGFTYTYILGVYGSAGPIQEFFAKLGERTWDLIVYDNSMIVWTDPNSQFDPLLEQLEAGAQLVMYSWSPLYVGGHANHDIWDYIGVDFSSLVVTPPPWYEWQPAHDVFTKKSPFPGPEYTTFRVWLYNGHRTNPVAGTSKAVAGWVPSADTNNQANLIVKDDKKVAYNTFTTIHYDDWDSDFDGARDMTEMYMNEVEMVVEASLGPSQKFEMPYKMTATHHYEDDHPITSTPWDYMDITVYVRDDDHGKLFPAKPYWYDDFSTNKGWSLQAYWEIDKTGPGASGFNGADPTEDHSPTDDNRILGTMVPGTFWHYYVNRRATSPVIDLSGTSGVIFLDYWKHDHTDYKNYQHWYFEVRDSGGTWQELWTGYNSPGANDQDWTLMSYDVTPYAAGNPNFQMRFRYVNNPGVFRVAGSNIDDILLWTSTPIPGMGSTFYTIKVQNCLPKLGGDLSPRVTKESKTILIDGLTIEDQAMEAETEWFAYRITGDWEGADQGWVYKGVIAPPKPKILLYHSLDTTGGPALRAAIEDIMPEGSVVDHVDFYTTLVDAAYMSNYDVVVTGVNLAPFNADAVGDALAEYADMGGNVVDTVASFHITCGWWGICGDWRDAGYQTLMPGGIGSSSTVSDIYDPSHPIIDGEFGTVTTFQTGIPVSMSSERAGTTLLADYPAYPAVAYTDEFNPNPGLGRIVGINVFYYPGFYDSGAFTLLANSIWWASGMVTPTPEIPPFEVHIGDNGIYTLDIQIIDDDMGWVWDPIAGEPVPADLPPGYEDYEPEITHNYLPIEVQNCHPVICDKKAYVIADVGLRLTGEKSNEATLTLYANDVAIGQVTVHRDPGSPDEGFIPNVQIDMTTETEYRVEVFYDPENDQGANPTWLMTVDFPDSGLHGKTLKHLFKSADGPQTWVIDNKQLKGLLVDQEIIFEACGKDQGSDDLAFVWVWSDGTPYGINIYSHKYDALWKSGVASDIPNQLPFEEPQYEYGPNSVRTGEIDPIIAYDTQMHTFAVTGRVFYVVLILMDDDVDDFYPMHQPWNSNHPGTDMDFLVLDLS